MASFDRKTCTPPINGPGAIAGKLEAWTLHKFRGPQFKRVADQGSAEHACFVWVDRWNTFGLGPKVPIASTNGGEALTALVDGKFATRRLPYPLGFFTKGSDGQIDDPNCGWKGRGLWTTSGTTAVLHGNGGGVAHPRCSNCRSGRARPRIEATACRELGPRGQADLFLAALRGEPRGGLSCICGTSAAWDKMTEIDNEFSQLAPDPVGQVRRETIITTSGPGLR
jgi:hypothetical protein